MIDADNPMSARSSAAQRLGVSRDDVELRPAGKGRYFASVREAPPAVNLAIDPDGLKAWVLWVKPPPGKGRPPSLDDIKDALKDAGIVYGVDREAVTELARRVRNEGVVEERVLVAVGKAPESVASDLEMLAGVGDLVTKGTVLAKKSQGEAVQGWGMKVSGEKIPPPKLEEIEPGEGALLSEDKTTYIADLTGFVVRAGDKLLVKPILVVSKDGMEARITVYPAREGRRMLSVAGLERILEENHIVYGLDKELVQEAIRKVEETGMPVDGALVAKGKPPDHGLDGRLDYQVDMAEKVGVPLEDGSMNFYERNLVTNVHAGQVLARRVPATQGEDGRTVTGQRLGARNGRDVQLKSGDNVNLSEDGLVFTSAIEGCVCVADGRVSVLDTFEIHKDIDFGTGNIDYNGYLKIFGTIRSNFSVKAKTHVLVRGTVEEARVEAGGDITIEGGVLMKGREATDEDQERRSGLGNIPENLGGRGYLLAGGMVNIAFMVNALVIAQKDVWVRNEAMNCAVFTNGKVLAVDGKGTIIGGVIRGALGVEVRQLGSDAGVRTDVVVDLDKRDYDDHRRVESEIANNEEEMRKIGRAISSGLIGKPEDVGSSKKREAVLKLLRYYKQLKVSTQDLKFRKEQIDELLELSKKATVKVFGDLYPGVQIRMQGRPFRVDKHTKGAKFRLDPIEDKVIRVPL